MRFEFATAARVVFGAGTSSEAGTIARDFGRRALVVTGRSTDRAGSVISALKSAGLAVTTFAVPGEPEIALVDRGRTLAREADCDMVVSVGGGSALDAGKAIAALAANDGDVLEYLEVIGRGQPLTKPSLPCITIPTTAGTGSEVTRNAVLGAPAERVKVSLRHAFMLPRVAIVDPDLTMTLPPAQTAASGVDAITQLIEPYVSTRANPMTDALCVEGIRRAAAALPAVMRNGADRDARASMSLASCWSGIALANAGLGAVHGFAGPIGGRFPAPHGAICAALLPHVMAANVRALDARAPDAPARRRYDDVGRLLSGRPTATAADAITWAHTIVETLGIPRLGTYGVSANDVDAIVAQAQRASSMKGNPVELDVKELKDCLKAAL